MRTLNRRARGRILLSNFLWKIRGFIDMTINCPLTARHHRDRAFRRAATLKRAVLALLLTCLVESAHAEHMNRTGLIEQTWNGVAIKGYDPVAYFEWGRAVRGSQYFEYEWLGQVWQFASARHLDLFASDPVEYVPQFGGYCTESHSVTDIDPTAWRIVGSRLYLFFSETSAEKFAQDERAQSWAEDHWGDVKSGLSR